MEIHYIVHIVCISSAYVRMPASVCLIDLDTFGGCFSAFKRVAVMCFACRAEDLLLIQYLF